MDDFKLNDRVIVIGKNTKGEIAFIGETHFSEGVMYGIVLDEPKGKYSGTVDGKRYFECPKNHATFVRACQLQKDANCSLEDGTMPAYPNYLKDSSSKHGLKTQDLLSKSERSNQTAKVKPVDMPNLNATKNKSCLDEIYTKVDPIMNEDVNPKPNYSMESNYINDPQEITSTAEINHHGTEEKLLTSGNIDLTEPFLDENYQKGDTTIEVPGKLGTESVLNEKFHDHKIKSLSEALEELRVLKQKLSERNKNMNAIHHHFRKLKTYLKWCKEIRKSNNIGDHRIENFLKLLVDSAMKKIEKIVSKGSNGMSPDCLKDGSVTSEENNFLLLYVDILEKRNEVLAESLTHVRDILERAWNQSRSKNRCKCKKNIEAPDVQGQCRECSSKLLSFTDVLEHETQLFLESNPMDYLEPIHFKKGLDVFKGSEKIKKYLESLTPDKEAESNQEKVEIRSDTNNENDNSSIDPQKIFTTEATDHQSLFHSFTEPDISLKYKNCPKNKPRLKFDSLSRKCPTKRTKEAHFKNILDPTKELQEFITEIVSRVFESNKSTDKTENASTSIKLDKPMPENEQQISVPENSNATVATSNPSESVEEAKVPKNSVKNKFERAPKFPKSDSLAEANKRNIFK